MNRICELFLWTILLSVLLAAYYYAIFWLPALNESTNPLQNPDENKLLPVNGSTKIKCSVCGISQKVGNLDGVYKEERCEELELNGANGVYTLDQCKAFPSNIDSACDCQTIPLFELCDNTEDLQDFLSTDGEFYMIELLELGENNANVADDVLTEYLDFLKSDILPGAEGEVIWDDVNRIAQWPHERPHWDQAIVTKYSSGYLFQKTVLENNFLFEQQRRKREAFWKNTYVWFGTAMSTTNFKNIATNDDDLRFLLHAMQFTKPDGQSLVSKFDKEVLMAKKDHDVILHGKWGIGFTCRGSNEYDQVRLESVPSLEAYSGLITDPKWSTSSRNRGLTGETFMSVARQS